METLKKQNAKLAHNSKGLESALLVERSAKESLIIQVAGLESRLKELEVELMFSDSELETGLQVQLQLIDPDQPKKRVVRK